MSALPEFVRPKIAAFIRLLASPSDGEALAAARAIARLLKASDLDLNDFGDMIERGPEPRTIYIERPAAKQQRQAPEFWSFSRRYDVAATLRTAIRAGILSDWEARFAVSIAKQIDLDRANNFSAKQIEQINEILSKINLHGVA